MHLMDAFGQLVEERALSLVRLTQELVSPLREELPVMDWNQTVSFEVEKALRQRLEVSEGQNLAWDAQTEIFSRHRRENLKLVYQKIRLRIFETNFQSWRRCQSRPATLELSQLGVETLVVALWFLAAIEYLQDVLHQFGPELRSEVDLANSFAELLVARQVSALLLLLQKKKWKKKTTMRPQSCWSRILSLLDSIFHLTYPLPFSGWEEAVWRFAAFFR